MSEEQPKKYGQLMDGALAVMKMLAIAEDTQVRIALTIAADRYVDYYIRHNPLPPKTSAPQEAILRSAMGASFIGTVLNDAAAAITGRSAEELLGNGPPEKEPTKEASDAAAAEALRAIHKAALP